MEAFDFGTPANPDNSDGGQVYVFGCRWGSTATGPVSGGRWRRPTNPPTVTCYMLLFRFSDQVELARKTFTPGVGDNDVFFDAAVNVAAGVDYVSAVLADRYAFTLGGWPFTTLSMTAAAGVNGLLTTTTAGNPVFPGTVHGSAANFFIGPLFTPDVTDFVRPGIVTPSPAAVVRAGSW